MRASLGFHLTTSIFKSNASLVDPKLARFKIFLETTVLKSPCPVVDVLVHFGAEFGVIFWTSFFWGPFWGLIF